MNDVDSKYWSRERQLLFPLAYEAYCKYGWLGSICCDGIGNPIHGDEVFEQMRQMHLHYERELMSSAYLNRRNYTPWVLIFLLIVIISTAMQGQTDSVRLTVTRARSSQDRTYYWFKDDNKNRYYTVCSCKQKHNKGDTIMIAKKDMEFIPGRVRLQ